MMVTNFVALCAAVFRYLRKISGGRYPPPVGARVRPPPSVRVLTILLMSKAKYNLEEIKTVFGMPGSYLDYMGLMSSIPSEWRIKTVKPRAEYPIFHPQVEFGAFHVNRDSQNWYPLRFCQNMVYLMAIG